MNAKTHTFHVLSIVLSITFCSMFLTAFSANVAAAVENDSEAQISQAPLSVEASVAAETQKNLGFKESSGVSEDILWRMGIVCLLMLLIFIALWLWKKKLKKQLTTNKSQHEITVLNTKRIGKSNLTWFECATTQPAESSDTQQAIHRTQLLLVEGNNGSIQLHSLSALEGASLIQSELQPDESNVSKHAIQTHQVNPITSSELNNAANQPANHT